MNLRIAAMLIVCLSCSIQAKADERAKLTPNQRLVVAAFELDVDQVKSLLKEGADPNSRFGTQGKEIFYDKWTLGWPVATARWTPLIAVAHSHRHPQPEKPAVNTVAGREAAIKQRNAIDPKLIVERNERRTTIAKLLIDAKADLDLDDGFGSTGFDGAVDEGYESIALLLVESGAKLDTKTGVYIDGPDGITPMHHAVSHPTILKAMLKRGAKVNVKSSDGDTPLHWATLHKQVESVKLLLEAGADPNAKNKDGLTPAYWCELRSTPEEKQIADLLAAKKK